MRFGKISLAAVAAASLMSAPVMAQAVSAAPNANSTAQVKRAGAEREDENKIGRGAGVILGILALVAIVGGIVIASGNNADTPTSP